MVRLLVYVALALPAVTSSAVAAVASSPFRAGTLTYSYEIGKGVDVSTTVALDGVMSIDDRAARHPIVVIMHGRHGACRQPEAAEPWGCPKGQTEIRSYDGYPYLVSALARRGYAVVSIDVNGAQVAEDISGPGDGWTGTLARGMYHRAAAARAILRRLAVANDGGANAFATPLAGRLDLQKVGLVGHSRGGEGVVTLTRLRGPEPYRLRSVFVISPVDFQGLAPADDVAFGSIISFCDGDVADLQGLRYFENARLRGRTAPAFQMIALGANHNFFNRAWEDEFGESFSSDGEAAVPPAWCSGPRRQGGGRLTRPETETLATRVITTFMDATVRNSRSARRLLAARHGSDGAPTPGLVAGAEVITSYLRPSAGRLDIDLARAKGRNALGGRVRPSGVDLRRCFGARRPCSAVMGTWFQRSIAYHLAWSEQGGVLREVLPAARRDLTSFARLTLRVGQPLALRAPWSEPTPEVPDPPPPPEPARAAQAFSLRVTDTSGRSASVVIGPEHPALRPVLDPNRGSVLGTVAVSLRRFRGVDLRRVRAIDIVLDQTSSGALLVGEISLDRKARR